MTTRTRHHLAVADATFEPFMVDDSQLGEVSWLRQETSESGMHLAGLWRAAAGEFPYHFAGDESFIVLEGSVEIRLADGTSQTVAAGEAASFPKGTDSTWSVDPRLVKFFVVSSRERPVATMENAAGGATSIQIARASATIGEFQTAFVDGISVGHINWLRGEAQDAGLQLGVDQGDAPRRFHLAGLWRCVERIEFPYYCVGHESFLMLEGVLEVRYPDGASEVFRAGEGTSYKEGTKSTCIVKEPLLQFFVITR